ncbi:hypothetical protein [Gordonia sp. VNK21]|uniref:hypothetical protein n=1 Tax=Gordonia sp. VNK21 TaxID=3382483 RepID=UPI0038D48C28
MTTVIFFVIAALALVGAAVLLWLDRNRSEQVHHQRAVWGEKHSFKFRDSDAKLRTAFHRAAMDVPGHLQVRDVAYGVYEGAETVVFDIDETSTIIAVRRPAASSVTVDLRYEDVLAPAEDDVDLLGAMGSRVMFASNLDAARRICDRRMVTLATTAPSYIEILWNEGNWALGALPLTTDDERLDTALDVVRRFADLLRVLPPTVDPQDAPDPRDPHGPITAGMAEEKTDSMRDEARRRRATGAAPSPEPAPEPAPARRPSALDATPRPAGPGAADPRGPRPAPAPRPSPLRRPPMEQSRPDVPRQDLPPTPDPREQ